jgi:hypothetical protein
MSNFDEDDGEWESGPGAWALRIAFLAFVGMMALIVGWMIRLVAR